MSKCLAGRASEAQIGRASRSVRHIDPVHSVEEHDATEGAFPEPTLEIVLRDTDRCPDEVHGHLEDEHLDILRAIPKGPHFVVIATA